MPNEQKYIRQFGIRQQRYEKRYERQFLDYLRRVYNDLRYAINDTEVTSANEVNEFFRTYELSQSERLENIFRKLYTTVSIDEAKQAYLEFIEPFEPNRLNKDILDNLVSILGTNAENGLINIWRNLLGEFLQVRVAQRITSIENTTRKRIQIIIEKSIEEGLGAEEIARTLRKEGAGEINMNRSRAIARTEVVSAQNQGQYMSAASSKFRYVKKWSARLDARTRNTHYLMNSQPWIDLEQEFRVPHPKGGYEYGLYPCDNELSAGNIVNCRCAMLLRPKKDSNGNLVRK